MQLADIKDSITPNMQGFIHIKDADFRTTWISEAWLKPLGFDYAEELIGTTPEDLNLFTDEMIQQYLQGDQIASRHNNWFGIDETIFVTHGQISLLTSKTALYDDAGNVCGVLVMDTPLLSKSQKQYINSLKTLTAPVRGKNQLLKLEINDDDKLHHLTPREQEVLFYAIYSKPNKEIASLLNISVKTVEFHITNIRHKFGSFNKSQMVEYASHAGYATHLPKLIAAVPGQYQ